MNETLQWVAIAGAWVSILFHGHKIQYRRMF